MICEKELRHELKRLPSIMKRYIKEGRLEDALEVKHEITTIDWILSERCECCE